MHLSIRRKLVLLLLSSLVLVLLMVGLSFNLVIRKFHEENAQERFNKFYREVALEMETREERVLRTVEEISKRSDIVSSVNMIHRYADPAQYQPLIFDTEKQKLTREMHELGHASGVGQLALYDAEGRLLAYHREMEPAAVGYVSYERGEPVVYSSSLDQPWRRGELPETVEGLDLPLPIATTAPGYRRCKHGVVIETSSPVVRQFPGGATEIVGYLVGKQFITDEFTRTLERSSDLEVALLFQDGHVGGLPDITWDDVRSTTFPKTPGAHVRVNHGQYFLAAIPITLQGGLTGILAAGIPTEVVASQIERTRSLMLFVLGFAALIILPVGLILARRTISEPVDRLVESAEALRRGDFSRKVQLPQRDELGHLAEAFNHMADTIAARQKSLVESESRYRTLLDSLPLSAFFKDTDSVYRSCNLHYAGDRGMAPEEIIGKSDYDFYPKELAERYRAADRAMMASGQVQEFEEPNLLRGSMRMVHTTKAPVRDASGNIIGVLGIYADITERKRAEDRLRQSAAVFESTAEGVMITDADKNIIAVNKAFTEITGFSAEEAVGKTPKLLRSERQDSNFYHIMWREIASTGRWQGEIWNRRKNGEVHPEWMTISVVRDNAGKIINFVAVFSDITAIKRSQAQLDHLAHHDPLTDLPNRLLFSARLNHAIEHARRDGRSVAVMFLDLDRFKVVNDTLGHPVGDQLLQKVAWRLRDGLRECDTIARLGGDEFVVTLEDVRELSEAATVAQKVLEMFNTPFRVGENDLHLGASIGIAVFPQDGADMSSLVKNADAAMYLAKQEGRNTFRFYTPDLGTETEERFHLEVGLRQAMERSELELFYQPQVDLATGRVTGAEALLRWRHPEHGLVAPDRFIPLAEETGLILPMGEWVLHTACRQFVAWRAAGMHMERIAINLSGLQIQRGDLVASVHRALDETGIEPSCLELEITESVIMQNAKRATVILDGLQDLGVELAVDDFGTGYSSLSYLKRFPLDNLKIDRSFVRDVPNDPNDAAIIRAVIALADHLQLHVTAEGVETEAQRAFLLAHGCHRGQGYLFSKPVPAGDFLALMENQRENPAEATTA